MGSSPEPDKLRQILTWVGVANQLMVTRLNRALKGTNLPLAQFVMLNHFGHFAGEGWTVTRLVAAFETGQPGISKTVKRLVEKGYLRVEPDPGDGRVKLHHMTEAGRRAHASALARIAPDAELIFADWTEANVEALHGLLFRLKSWLDANRDTRAARGGPRAPQ